MKRYVVGFMFNDDMKSVVLVCKNRPAWQAGLLNGVGGHIEEGESPAQAMAREFSEETGVDTTPDTWSHVLTLRFTYAEVEFFAARSGDAFQQVETRTDEAIVRHCVHKVEFFGVIGNIPPLLQLSIQRLSDHEGVAPVVWANQQKEA